jgi:hypothetical protein
MIEVLISAFPPRGIARVLLHIEHFTTELAWLNITCSFPHSLHLTRKKQGGRGLVSMFITYSLISIPFDLKPRSGCDLPQTLHFNIKVIFFAVFANFFCSDLGWLPYPFITRAN